MSGEGGPWSCLTASIRTHRCHLHYDNISPRSYQLGNIALHGCQVGWKEGTRSPKDSNLCGCDTRLSVVCPPQMVKNQYEVFVRNKQTNKQMYPDDKPVFGQKKVFFMAILKFSDETGSRFFKLLDFTIHFNRT